MNKLKAQKIYEKRMESAREIFKEDTANAYAKYEHAMKQHAKELVKAVKPFRKKLERARDKALEEFSKNIGQEV